VRRLTDKEINVTPGDFRPPPHARWAWIGVTSAAAASFIAAQAARAEVNTIPGMPPVIDHQHIVSETTRSDLAPDMAKDFARLYLPNQPSNNACIIDPSTFAIVGGCPVERSPQGRFVFGRAQIRKTVRSCLPEPGAID
jgi:hypothetical protein